MLIRHALAAFGLSTLMATLSSAAQAAEVSLTQQQWALVKEACTATLHIERSVIDRDACMSSLGMSLAAKIDVQNDMQYRMDCATAGGHVGTPAFYECEVAKWQSALAATPSVKPDGFKWLSPLRFDLPPVTDQYHSASFQTVRDREEAACAQVGLDPIISGCVAALDAALFTAEHSSS